MQQLRYVRPGSVDGVCSSLDEHGTDVAVLAGGQSLVLDLQSGDSPDVDGVVDVGRIESLDRIDVTTDAVTVGAAATYERVAGAAAVQDGLPVLPEMIGYVGDRQVRARGTLVGGLAYADPAGHPPTLAVGLDAEVTALSADGSRTIPAEEFYTGPFETALGPTEFIPEVTLPIPSGDATVVFECVSGPQDATTVVTLAAVIRHDGAHVVDCRFAVGNVTATPDRLDDVEALLSGTDVPAVADEVVAAATANVEPTVEDRWSDRYRREMVGTLVADALDRVSEASQGSDGGEATHG